MGNKIIYANTSYLVCLALLYTFWKSSWVSKQEVGTEKMARIAKNISDGAMAFLKAEYKVLINICSCSCTILAFSGNAANSSSIGSSFIYFWSYLFCIGRISLE